MARGYARTRCPVKGCDEACDSMHALQSHFRREHGGRGTVPPKEPE